MDGFHINLYSDLEDQIVGEIKFFCFNPVLYEIWNTDGKGADTDRSDDGKRSDCAGTVDDPQSW